MARLLLAGSLVLIALAASPTQAAESRQVITLDYALQTALQKHPQIHQASASVEASQARSNQSYSNLLPQVSAGASYLPGLSGGTARQSNGVSMSLSADYTLYDFGQNSNRHQAATTLVSAQQDSERLTKLEVIQELRTAYFAAKAGGVMVTVAQESLQNQQRHLDQVKGFVLAGTRPPIDLAQSMKDQTNAQVQLIEAQNSYEIAKAQLNQAMGIEGDTDYALGNESMPKVSGEDGGLDALLKEAIANHPEYAALTKQVQAQELTLSALKSAGMPSLRASTRVSDSDFNTSNLNLEAGVSMSWPIFTGGSYEAQRQEATANLTRIHAQVEAQKQALRLEVERARLAVKSGKMATYAASQSTKNAQEQLKLAEGRYAAGLGNVIELGDAQLSLTNAKAQAIQLDYKLATARIQLLKALGRM